VRYVGRQNFKAFLRTMFWFNLRPNFHLQCRFEFATRRTNRDLSSLPVLTIALAMYATILQFASQMLRLIVLGMTWCMKEKYFLNKLEHNKNTVCKILRNNTRVKLSELSVEPITLSIIKF